MRIIGGSTWLAPGAKLICDYWGAHDVARLEDRTRMVLDASCLECECEGVRLVLRDIKTQGHRGAQLGSSDVMAAAAST